MQADDPIPADRIAQSILVVRDKKVLVDAELASLYGTSTKRLNEQVKRNQARFPDDFAFRLTPAEVEELNRSQFATGPQKHRDPRFPPWVFTEHGALAAAFVLNTQKAIAVGEVVVRAFVKLRELASSHRDLAQRLDALEGKVGAHDKDLRAVYRALQRLLEATPPAAGRPRIGFQEE